MTPAVRLLTFIPAVMTAAGSPQAAMHCCAYFGIASPLNFGPQAGQTDTVAEQRFAGKTA